MRSLSDSALAQLLLKKQILSPSKVDECLKASMEKPDGGGAPALRDVLIRKGYVSAGQLAQLELAEEGQPSTSRPAALRRFGQYELLTFLGRGAMAEVYLARAEGQTEPVAVKILHAEVSQRPDLVDRLKRELRALLTLRHRSIVRGLGFGNIDGRFYLAMEYVEGQTLNQVVKSRGPFPEPEALRIVEQVAEALDYAYQEGFIHRDIKPQNLFLQRDGGVRILDFGLSKSVASESQELTGEGRLLGTVVYASPEQLRDSSRADCRADIYSLGITLYYLLIGNVPFRGESSVSTALMHFELPIPDLRTQRPDLSPGVCRLIERMTQKAPEKRHQTPGELLDDIRWLRHDMGQAGDESTVSSTGVLPRPRLRRRVSIAAGVAILLIPLVAAVLWAILTPPRPLRLAGPDTGRSPPSPGDVQRRSPADPAPGTPLHPEEGFQEIQQRVDARLEIRDYRAAMDLLDSFARTSAAATWAQAIDVLRDRIRRKAHEWIQERQEEWLRVAAFDEMMTRLQEMALLDERIPDDLRPRLAEIRQQMVANYEKAQEARRGSERPAGPPGEATSDTAAKPDPRTASPAGPNRDVPSTPGATATPPSSGIHDPEATAWLGTAAQKIATGEWPAGRNLLRSMPQRLLSHPALEQKRVALLEQTIDAEVATLPLERVIAGTVTAVGEGEVEVSYDFSDPQQMRDWLPLGGEWEPRLAGLHRMSAGRREVLWWRHPHSPGTRVTVTGRSPGPLACIVGGDGFSVDEGTGLVCGLGYCRQMMALVRVSPSVELAREEYETRSNAFHTVGVRLASGEVQMEADGRALLRLPVRPKWLPAGPAGGMHLGILGAGDAGTVFRSVTIRTRLPDEWIEVERGRIRAELRTRLQIPMPQRALRITGGGRYAILPVRTLRELEAAAAGEGESSNPGVTLEFWFGLPREDGRFRGELVNFGGPDEGAVVRVEGAAPEFRLIHAVDGNEGSLRISPGWHHFALVWSRRKAWIFCDGKPVRSSVSLRRALLPSPFVLIGSGVEESSRMDVDELRLSRVARYSKPFRPDRSFTTDADAIALLRFNEVRSSMALDSSRSGNHACLYGLECEEVTE